jgi:hypothetical protein
MNRIEPIEKGAEMTPPTGGSWRRDEDGGLTPLDEQTAYGAGLEWPAVQPKIKPTAGIKE